MTLSFTPEEDEIIIAAHERAPRRYAIIASEEIFDKTGVLHPTSTISSRYISWLSPQAARAREGKSVAHPLQKRFRHLSAATCAKVQELREKYADILCK